MSVNAQRVQLGPFFDGGALCGAALLYHYEAGTTTLQNLWSDRTKTTTLAQPLVSDANGIFDFFADGLYKFVIKKADGTTLKTLDNWKFLDLAETTFAEGDAVDTASTINIGSSVWAHWAGSVDVSTITGDSIFYWAVAGGNFSLIHSASLVMPDSRNRKVLAGDILFFINDGEGVFRLAGQFQTEGGWTGRQGAEQVASATLTIPTDGDFIDVSGATTITAIATAKAGYRFRARFTGTGLNLTHHATSLISPWGRDYRTIQNEILEFMSLGAGNWIFFSVNGPKDRVGTVISSDSPNAPAGYLVRDGTAYSRTTYSGLFGEIQTTHGAGDGSSTFNVADARGRCPIHVDGSAAVITTASTNGANADFIGGKGGAQTHTLDTSEMPAHTHTAGTPVTNTAGAVVAAGSDKGTTSITTGSTGGGGAHSNTQPWITVYTYIRF